MDARDKKQLLLDSRYLRMTQIWAENSYCRRRQVGALLVKDKMIISDGYNGTPSGFENVCEEDADHSISNIRYADPVPVFPIQSPQLSSLQWLREDDAVLCLTGIATPKPLVRYLRCFAAQIKVMHFDDHHFFTRRDFNDIFRVYKGLEGKRKFIITTEKDAVRIMNNPYFPPTKRNCIYYIPMKVGFLEMEGSNFIDELCQLIDKQDESQPISTNDYTQQ